MRSPADMMVIQIDITNACNKRCSNCTRFCGNHKKPFFMSFDTFKRAVDSMEGYEGVTGVMGGEPTLHPEFERFVLYLHQKLGKRREENRLIYPHREFIKEVQHREFESHVLRKSKDESSFFRMNGLGLWSNMGETYRKYYELIQDSFNVQFLNDHINPSYHQPGLISRKDLGIPDEEWVKMRDRCWIQNEWSATITPKGAFFCEIAGALDMLFDGPGGWKIEPGWWKRTPEEFGDQLHWCELCGFALDTFMRDAEENIDDVSPTLYKMLEEAGSPRIKEGRVNAVKIENGMIAEESKAAGKHFAKYQPYIEHYEDRFNEKNSVLFVKKYDKIAIPDGEEFGRKLNHALEEAEEWILFMLDEEPETGNLDEILAGCVLNPGTMHLGKGYAFFSKNALSLRQYGYDRIAHTERFDEIIEIWQQEKVVHMDEIQERTRWKRDTIIVGKRYVIWGTGLSGGFIADLIDGSGGRLVFAVDGNPIKEGAEFYGAVTYEPAYAAEHTQDYDYLIIGHYSLFEEIYQQALELGIDRNKILMPYEV